MLPFWRAVLGYEYRDDSPDEDLIDPHGRGAPFWFQQMDAPEWWVLADAEGDEVDVCTTMGRD